MNTKNLNTWLEISESAYAANLQFFKKRLPARTEFSVVVKANAYGHGVRQIAPLAVQYGADSFCVHSLEEAFQLREMGIEKDILIMGHVPLDLMEEAVRHNFRIALFNREALDRLSEITRRLQMPVRVHLKLETGTYRQGIMAEALPDIINGIFHNKWIRLESIYTHFANIEDTTDHSYAMQQLSRLEDQFKKIKSTGFDGLKIHCACSAAILLFPETYFDMVRLGISQYGLWPSRETFVSYKTRHTQNGEDVLKPVLTWKTRIGQIKAVPAHQPIGYGGTFHTTRPSRLAILPIGYADGYDRHLSNQGHVLVHGKRAPIRGRVCMNMTIVDVTDIPEARYGDEVVLLGRQGRENISAEMLAGWCGTINYEFITRISPSIQRFVVE